MKATVFERVLAVIADIATVAMSAYAIWFLYHITPLLIEVV